MGFLPRWTRKSIDIHFAQAKLTPRQVTSFVKQIVHNKFSNRKSFINLFCGREMRVQPKFWEVSRNKCCGRSPRRVKRHVVLLIHRWTKVRNTNTSIQKISSIKSPDDTKKPLKTAKLTKSLLADCIEANSGTLKRFRKVSGICTKSALQTLRLVSNTYTN